MLKWDEVRKLLVQHLAPSVIDLGFNNPGRTMRRFRGEFVDIIDFRCYKYNGRAVISLGCGLRKFMKNNPKPVNCIFHVQPFDSLNENWLNFHNSADEQIQSFEEFAPFFTKEVELWFDLFPDIQTAIKAASNNTFSGPDHVAMFNVPSPAYDRAIEQLNSLSNN